MRIVQGASQWPIQLVVRLAGDVGSERHQRLPHAYHTLRNRGVTAVWPVRNKTACQGRSQYCSFHWGSFVLALV
jgi:hypothetical protein